MSTKHKSSLGVGLRYGYGLGEFGMNFLLTYITYYLTFYLTNVAGISIALAATVTTVTTIIKVFGMPLAGTLIDSVRFKTSRFRTWMVIGGIIYAVGGTLLFTHLDVAPGIYSVLFCVFFFVYWLGYSIAWTAFRALMDPICSNPIDKVGLTAAASQEGTIARMIFAGISAAILAAFTSVDGSVAAVGYTVVNLVFGIISVVCFLIVSIVVKKYDTITEGNAVDSPEKPKPQQRKSSKQDYINTIKTRPMLIFILCAIFRCAVLTVMGTLLVYFLTYVLGNAGIAAVYMLLVYAISFFGAMLVQPLAKRIGKRNTFVWTTALSALCPLGLLFTGTSSVGFIVLMCIFQFLGIFSSTLIPTCMADIGEYNSMVNGSNAAGLTFSIGGMAIQISSVLGAALAAFGMAAVGFDANNVTAAAVTGIQNLYIWGLFGLSLLSAVLFLFYPLTEDYMDKVRVEHGMPTAAERAKAAAAAAAAPAPAPAEEPAPEAEPAESAEKKEE